MERYQIQLKNLNQAQDLRGEMSFSKICDVSSLKLKLISQGAFGTIYLAFSQKQPLVPEYAIKKLPIIIQKAGFPSILIKQISILKELNHPSIVKLIQCQFKSRYAYLILEYFDSDLNTRILSDPLICTKIYKIKAILKQILEGVEHMHKRKICHRDIKTKNILIDLNDRTVLCDLGSARRMQTLDPPYTENMGTLWYRAPQLLLGIRRYDQKVDIWSVGCVLAEMLTRKIFFQGESQIDQISIIFQTLGPPTQQSWPQAFQNTKIKLNFSQMQYQSKLASKIQQNSPVEDKQQLKKGIALLEKLLVCNPKQRISAREALEDPFFDEASK